MIATSNATTSEMSAAHCAFILTRPSSTNSVRSGSTAKIVDSPSESPTGSKTCLYMPCSSLGRRVTLPPPPEYVRTATCSILASAAVAAPERAQVGVDRREVLVGHDLRREEPAGVHAAEIVEIASAGQLRPALPLRVVP